MNVQEYRAYDGTTSGEATVEAIARERAERKANVSQLPVRRMVSRRAVERAERNQSSHQQSSHIQYRKLNK
jgi:hypothetical protein